MRVEDALGAFVNRMGNFERLCVGIQRGLQDSGILTVFVHPVDQALDSFDHRIGSVEYSSLAFVDTLQAYLGLLETLIVEIRGYRHMTEM